MKTPILILSLLAVPLFFLPLACSQKTSTGPTQGTSTPTPAFNCVMTITPQVLCPGFRLTPTPTQGPCLTTAPANGYGELDICGYSSNSLVKTILVSGSLSFSSNWTSQVSVTPSNLIASLNTSLYFDYMGTLIAVWDGTDQGGTPVPNGCYAFHMRYTDGSGNFQQAYLPVMVNRDLGNVVVAVFDNTSTEVRSLYNYTADAGVSTSVTGVTLSTSSFQPSYCSAGPTPSQVAIACSNGMTLTWDGRNDAGTILPGGNYTIQVCSSNGSGTSNLSSPVTTSPLPEASAATTIVPSPNPATAGSVVVFYATPCAGNLTLALSAYNSGNSLVGTVTGASGSNQVSFSTTGLPTGNYTGKVAVYDTGGYTGTVTVPFVLN